MTFLTYMAEQPAFIRHNGLSAIQNIKKEKLYDVLVYASQKKEMDELINNFYDSQK